MERAVEMRAYVLDTSVVIKWFSEYDENDLENASRLRHDVMGGICSVTVPDLIFYELGNVLRYNPRFAVKDVKDALSSVLDMGFDVRTIEKSMLDRAIEMAFSFSVTVYDACFLALSIQEDKPFITADKKLARRISGFKNVMPLSDY